MERIEKYGIFCRSWEGGWSNHPDDAGGATMKGVTYKRFCEFRKSKGLPKPSLLDLKNITDKEWDSIMRQGYWDKVKADQIASEWIAYLLVDCIWMSGVGYIKKVQTIIGVKADGIVGAKTLAKLNSFDQKSLFSILWKQRENNLRYIATLRNNKVFLEGWLRRLNSVKYGSLTCNGGKKLT